jgi:hypothetical protein
LVGDLEHFFNILWMSSSQLTNSDFSGVGEAPTSWIFLGRPPESAPSLGPEPRPGLLEWRWHEKGILDLDYGSGKRLPGEVGSGGSCGGGGESPV